MNALLQLLLGLGGWGAGSWALKRLLMSGLAKQLPARLGQMLGSSAAQFGAGYGGATLAESLGGKMLGTNESEPGTPGSPWMRPRQDDFRPNVRTEVQDPEGLLRLLRDYQGIL